MDQNEAIRDISTLPAIRQPEDEPIRSSAQLLDYERQIVEDLIAENALCITSSGMGWQKVVAVLVRLHGQNQPGVVLILGCQPWQKDLICREVHRHQVKHEGSLQDLVPVDINNEVPALERIELYKNPSCCFVTTRILVVDFLTSRVLPKNVAGIIIVNAHRVTDMSGEAFAVRLYRAGNSTGFVRAISDQPCGFSSGFNKVEKVMKSLHVRRLALWPRFHAYVQEELDASGPEVVEWSQPLTPAMQHIQASITEILDTLIKDLKRTNRIDCSDLKLENGLSRSFDDIVRRQLDPVWHTVSTKTRQIVRDLRTLRQLALYLVRHDAVTFLSFLEGLRGSEGKACVWIYHDAAHTLFEMARRRVYMYRSGSSDRLKGPAPQVARAAATLSGSSEAGFPVKSKGKRKQQSTAQEGKMDDAVTPSAPVLEVVLEEMPKWGLLSEVLREVQSRRREWRTAPEGRPQAADPDPEPAQAARSADPDPKSASANGADKAADPPALLYDDDDVQIVDHTPPVKYSRVKVAQADWDGDSLRASGHAPVLVVAREPHMCAQLEQTIRLGGKPVMQAMYEAYLISSMRKGSSHSGWSAAGVGAAEGGGDGAAGGGRATGRGAGAVGRGRGRWGRSRDNSWSDVVTGTKLGPAPKPGELQALKQAAVDLAKQRRQQVLAAGGGRRGSSRSGVRRGRGRGRAGGAENLVYDGSVSVMEDIPHPACDVKRARVKRHMDDSPPPLSNSAPPLSNSADRVEDVRSAGRSLGEDERRGLPALGRRDSLLGVKEQLEARRPVQTSHQPQWPPSPQSLSLADTSAPAAAVGNPSIVPKAAAPPSEPPQALIDGVEGTTHLLDGVHFYALDSKQDDILWQVRPSIVVLYEPDLAFIRQIEVYQAERQGMPLVVHSMTYSDSLEGQAHLAAVERERQALVNLIEFKQHIVIPVDLAPGQQVEVWTPPEGATDTSAQNRLTRQGGLHPLLPSSSSAAVGAAKRLVVDMREFMSGLPSVLHHKGLQLAPVTLEVGDYVLSPEICVERKAIPDLHSSMASGRLYQQAEAMCKHYKTPVLLIEFDPDRAFTLQSVHELGDDIDGKSILSKLVLLILHFPKLRLVWSRSPHATADIFLELKRNQDEPDPVAAALVGLPPGNASSNVSSSEIILNQPAMDLLRRLPGVNDSNFRPIMSAMGSLRRLANASVEELEACMGAAKNARALREFLDAPCPHVG